MLFVQISAISLNQGTEVADRPGGQAHGRSRSWRGVGRELGDVAGRQVRQIRAAERRFRKDVRCGVLSGETGQGIELTSDVQRQIPDNPKLQKARGPRPAGFCEEASGPASGGHRIGGFGRAHCRAANNQVGSIRR